MRERLVDLVLHGNKRATAGLLSDYESEGEPILTCIERPSVALKNEASRGNQASSTFIRYPVSMESERYALGKFDSGHVTPCKVLSVNDHELG